MGLCCRDHTCAFVGYCMAAMEEGVVMVERVVVCGSGVCMEEREETPLQGEDESRRSSPP